PASGILVRFSLQEHEMFDVRRCLRRSDEAVIAGDLTRLASLGLQHLDERIGFPRALRAARHSAAWRQLANKASSATSRSRRDAETMNRGAFTLLCALALVAGWFTAKLVKRLRPILPAGDPRRYLCAWVSAVEARARASRATTKQNESPIR